MTLGEKLKQVRSDHNYTQEEIAEKLGVSRRTISSWENDKYLPDILSIIRLSEIYSITIDELLRDNNLIDQLNSDIRYWQNGDYFCAVYLNGKFISGSDSFLTDPQNPFINICTFNENDLRIVKCFYFEGKRNEISNPLFLKYTDISYARLLVLRRLTRRRDKLIPISFYYKFMLQLRLKDNLYLNLELNPVYEMKDVFTHLSRIIPFDDPLHVMDQMKDRTTFYGTDKQVNNNYPFRDNPAGGFQGWANDHFDIWKEKYDLPELKLSYDSVNHGDEMNSVSINKPVIVELTEDEARKMQIFSSNKKLVIGLIIFWSIVLAIMIVSRFF